MPSSAQSHSSAGICLSSWLVSVLEGFLYGLLFLVTHTYRLSNFGVRIEPLVGKYFYCTFI